jgi:hypothetical protein
MPRRSQGKTPNNGVKPVNESMLGKGDPLLTTFYERAIRAPIGQGLKAGYDLSRPMPNRLFTLLMQLNELEPGDSAGNQTDTKNGHAETKNGHADT